MDGRHTIEAFHWEIIPHAAYSPELAPSNYHLFALIGQTLVEQLFSFDDDVRNWLDAWFY